MKRLLLYGAILPGCQCTWPDSPKHSTEPPPECALDPDVDDDGFDAPECGGDDCDDVDPEIHPGAPETASSGWTTETVWTGGAAAEAIAAAGDEWGDVHVVFSTSGHPRYARRDGSGWTVESLEDASGASLAHSISSTSIALDATGAPLLAWLGEWNGVGREGLQFASGRGPWQVENVDAQVTALSASGLVVDETDVPHVVYEDGGVRHSVQGASQWMSESIDEDGFSASVTSAEGHLWIAYYAPMQERYVARVARPGPDGWETTDIAAMDFEVPPVPAPWVGVDAFGAAHYVLTDSRGILHVSDRGGVSSDPEVIDPDGYAPAAAVDAGGTVHVAYETAEGIRVTTGRQGDWTTEPISDDRGPVAIALGPDGWVTVLIAVSDTVVAASNRPVEDGVDANCDGVALDACPDADRDGQLPFACGGTDCDDSRSEVGLGGHDVVGDAVDEDCDGLDGVDRDGDGHASLESGGDDCDDSHAVVHPGATELDDCVDEDCDGRGVPDDDRDGHVGVACGGDDCDDGAAATFPSAPDAAGDAVDENCDGTDGVDADLDEYASVASGGDDCDDSSAVVNPTAPDGPRVWRKISVETSDDPISPSIAFDSADVLHAAWFRQRTGLVRHGRRAPDLTWTHGTIDDVGDGDPDPVIAVGPAGDAEVAYRENVADELRWATNASGAWAHESVDAVGTPGTDNAIAIAPDGTVHVAYVDAWDRDTLEYATRAGGVWSLETVDSNGAVGHDVAIALDSAGAVHLAYAELGDEDLRYATNASGVWDVETIDAGASCAQYISLAIGMDGALHVAYRVGDPGIDAAARLWYATNASGAWEAESPDPAPDGARGTGIVVDGSGVVRIAEVADGDLVLVTNGSGVWEAEPIATGRYDEIAFGVDGAGSAHVLSVDTRFGDLVEWTDDVRPDGIDQNCDGADGIDADGDGHASIESGGDDCDDSDAAVQTCGA